jgi:hypothetical protein
MILKWIQSVIQGAKGQTDFAPPSAQNKTPLTDVAHEVLSKEAQERQAALKGFEKYGAPLIQRQERKVKIRTKIKHLLHIPLTSDEESDLVEEITERIAEAAEADPYYQRMFGENSKR